MHARQVAGVGQLPGQADRGVQAVLELVDQAARTAVIEGSFSEGSIMLRAGEVVQSA